MPTLFDHIAVAAETLHDGAAAVEAALGVPLDPGGAHALMGTHNRLLALGPGAYLEVIAIDPAAAAPAHPRWFDLDRFAGPARPQCWIARADDLDRALAVAPPGTGRPLEFARGDLRWRMAVPEDGRLPFDNRFPALIEWQGTGHAADRLPPRGCALERLVLIHPDAPALRAALGALMADARIVIEPGETPGMVAEIATPHGVRRLE